MLTFNVTLAVRVADSLQIDGLEGVAALVRDALNAAPDGVVAEVKRVRHERRAICPGCSGVGSKTWDRFVFFCTKCGAMFTFGGAVSADVFRCYVNQMEWADGAGKELQYFDFNVVGKGRAHGWIERSTRRLVQVG